MENIIIYHSYCSVHLTVSNYRFFVVSVANAFECRIFFLFNNFLNSYQQTKMYRMANIRSAQKDNHVSKKAIFFALTMSLAMFDTSALSVALSNWMKFNTFTKILIPLLNRSSWIVKILSWYAVFIHPFADSLSFVSYFMDDEIILR